jgi:hypothetical protein
VDLSSQAATEMRAPDLLRIVVGASILAASCLALPAQLDGAAQGAARRAATPQDAITAILDAFRSYRVVSFPGGHTDPNESQALLRRLVADPRFGATVNDIVVEFGSSRYQDLMDRYIRGDDVPESDVRRAWLDAVQPGISLDNQNTAAFFRAVREANAMRPTAEKTRVLLGDPPIDWANVRDRADYRKWEIQRDSYPADLVRRLVLAHDRRALVVYANGHLMRQEILTNYDMTSWQSQTIVSLIEAPGGTPVFTVRAEGSLTEWQPDTAAWKPMSLTIVRGTVIGAADFSEFEQPDQRYVVRGENDFVPIPRTQWASRRLEDIVDAILYTGPASSHTSSGIWAELCADPGYVRMRIGRITLIGLPAAQADAVRRVCKE